MRSLIPHPRRRSARVATLSLLVTLTTTALMFVSSSPASAGDYTVKYCQFGMPLQDWQPYRDAPGSLAESCAAGPGRLVATLDPSNATGNSRVEWLLRWPSRIRPVYLRAQANRTLHAGTGMAEGGIGPYGICSTAAQGTSCPSGQTTSFSVNRAVSEAAGAPDQRFWVGVTCGRSVLTLCENASGSVEVMQLEVTWRDTTPPTGSASIGTLASSATPVKGTHLVEYRAIDSEGSGVQRVEARIDETTVAVSPAQCSEPYTSMRACPAGAIGQLTVDTNQVDDGTHQLQIVAIDVAGNEHVLQAAQVITQNRDSVGPGSDPALRGQPNGTHSADDARLNAWWPATTKAPSKNRRVRKRCASSARYRRTHQIACRGKAPSRKLAARYSSRTANTLRGRLLTPTGEAIAGATLQLIAAPTASGTTPAAIGTLTTDGTGRFTARVPAKSGSATYQVQWLARTRDTIPATVVELTRTVRAATSLAIKPSPTVYRRQRLELTGQLSGTTGTPQGTAIVIQANAGSGWRAVTTVRSRTNGRWTARYRVPRQLRGVYRFRAVVKPSAAYAYATGTTKAKRIRVR